MLVYNSVVYVVACFVLSQEMGLVGLVYANCINMAVRGVFSLKLQL
jgi:hypothetical protein